jgi:N-acetyl-anhydromuramyl-L-alanine amidase AmpD
MDIKWIGSPYFGYPDGTKGRNGRQPIAVVLHIAEGSLLGCDAWFNSPNNAGSSTQYCIGKRGEIHQYVEETDAAWGNGQVRKPSWRLLIPDVNPNLYTISIEHEGFTGQPWTEEMYQADVWLIKQICQRWRIPIDRDHIIGHYQIDSVTRARCPGTGLPWDRLLGDLAAPEPLEQQVEDLKKQVADLQTQVADLARQAQDLRQRGDDLQARLSSIGRLVKTADEAQVYLLKTPMLYPIADLQTLERLYSSTLVETVATAELANLPKGPEIRV